MAEIDDYFVDEDTPEVSVSERYELIRALKRGEVVLSHSSFNAFCNSPRHFIDYKLRTFEPTPSMKFGSMVHCAILEPEHFESRYYVLPGSDERPEQDKNMNSKINQAWKAEMILLANGREVVEAKDYDTARRIGDSIRKSDVASILLEKCHVFEVPIEWEYKGFKWRGVMDGDGRKNGLIMDLKVLTDASPRKVANYVKYEGAGRQAVHYLRGSNAPEDCEYFILAVERSGNYSVSKLGRGLINQLSREIDWYISQFKRCIFTGDWHSSFDFYGNQDGHFEINSL